MSVFWLKFANFQVKLFRLCVYEVFGYVFMHREHKLCSVHQEGSDRILGAWPMAVLSRLLLSMYP